MTGVTVLLTVFAATGTTFAAEPSAALRHGVLVGLVAALIGLAFTGLTPAAVAIFGLTVAAGAAGGRLGAWLRGSRKHSPHPAACGRRPSPVATGEGTGATCKWVPR